MFDKLDTLPSILSKEIRQRFAYAIDPDSMKFMPVFSSATILNPELYALLLDELFNAGKEEIKVWINRLPPQQAVQTPVRQQAMFSRLSNQRLANVNTERSSNRFVNSYNVLCLLVF